MPRMPENVRWDDLLRSCGMVDELKSSSYKCLLGCLKRVPRNSACPDERAGASRECWRAYGRAPAGSGDAGKWHTRSRFFRESERNPPSYRDIRLKLHFSHSPGRLSHSERIPGATQRIRPLSQLIRGCRGSSLAGNRGISRAFAQRYVPTAGRDLGGHLHRQARFRRARKRCV
jgi:hypothetical protein